MVRIQIWVNPRLFSFNNKISKEITDKDDLFELFPDFFSNNEYCHMVTCIKKG